jgi:hypothetical protein
MPDKTQKTDENLAYVTWYAQDQQLQSFLLNSMTKEVLGQVATKTPTAGAWRAILGMFVSHSRACIVHLRSKLNNTCKGHSTCLAYYAQMKGFLHGGAGKQLDDERM